jgi:hypothetical protein
MVVHHTDGLQMCVDGCRADKHEAALLEFFAKCFGLWRHGSLFVQPSLYDVYSTAVSKKIGPSNLVMVLRQKNCCEIGI